MIKVSGIKTVIVIIGFYLVIFLNHLHACHESHFSGEELLVGTSFFGGHTGDNKIGRAVSVRENFQKLAGNIIESITITSYYTSGITVHDVANKGNMVEVGSFDTSPNFSGNGFFGWF